MKIEKLTDNKIRIILNIDELPEKIIDLHTLSQNNSTVHSLFKKILVEAEKQVGFKVQNCRLLIEAFSTSEGYIVFTLTKYKDEIQIEKPIKKPICKRKTVNTACKNAIYKFTTFEEFCGYCTYCKQTKLLDLTGLAKKISLYEYNNTYFLVLSSINQEYTYYKLFHTSISEFSSLVSNSSIFKSKLEEHGKVIFKANAIRNGIKYFDNCSNLC